MGGSCGESPSIGRGVLEVPVKSGSRLVGRSEVRSELLGGCVSVNGDKELRNPRNNVNVLVE